MSQLFLYFSLALISLWTARLARNKGQNYWVWGGASVFLTFLPQLFNSDLNVLGMVPIIVLMFVRAPKSASDAEDIEIICARCQTSHTRGHNFCVNCGLELRAPYAEGIDGTAEQTPAQDVVSQVQTASAGPVSPSLVSDSIPADSAQTTIVDVHSHEEPFPLPDSEDQPTEEEILETKFFSGPPTPERMTERGSDFMKDGRIQEAIDQFTKAIALDAGYKPAWSQRAEAYGEMGRNVEAADDLRRLEAI